MIVEYWYKTKGDSVEEFLLVWREEFVSFVTYCVIHIDFKESGETFNLKQYTHILQCKQKQIKSATGK